MYAAGIPGKWNVTDNLSIYLGTDLFDGMSGNTWDVSHSRINIRQNTQWNGSTFVPDTNECVIASLVHDLLFPFIYASIEKEGRAPYIYHANKIYYRICYAQGMLRFRAKIRYYGLKLFGPVYAYLKGW